MYSGANSQVNAYPSYGTYMPQGASYPGHEDEDKYIMTTKIMVLALAVLFAVVFFVVCLHIYARWVWSAGAVWPWRRGRGGGGEGGGEGGAGPGDENMVLDADVVDINAVMGLGRAAVEALPKFRCGGAGECAICLGRLQDGEVGRALPKCGHRFHLECIDMWLHSHSTCPLCRAALDPPADEAISLSFDAPAIQLFLLDPSASPDHAPPLLRDPDAANKRADSIPANVLFWGNHAHHHSSPHLAIHIHLDDDAAPLQMRVTPFRPSPSPSPSDGAGAPSRATQEP